jgi:MFS family permease
MTLAWQAQMVAIAWQVYSMTKDPLSLGLVGLTEVIPAIFFAMIAGHIVDRRDRKKIIISSQSLILVVSFSLWALTYAGDLLSNQMHLFFIYSCVFLLGAGRAFLGTAQFAFFGEIFDREQYVIASTWVSTVWQVAATLGPAIGGIIYGQVGVSITFLFCALLASLAAASISVIPGRGKIEAVQAENFTESLFTGIRFVRKSPVILGAISLDLFAVLFGGAVALLPIFADYLSVGPEGLGMLRAAPSVGAFFTGLWLTQRTPRKNVGPLMLTSVAGFGICMILFALSKNFIFSLVLLALSGALDGVSVVIRSAILQLATPGHMRGRVAAVNSIFITSSNELGAFESGVAAKWMGVIPSVIFGGTMTLLVVGLTAYLSPELRRLSFENDKKR